MKNLLKSLSIRWKMVGSTCLILALTVGAFLWIFSNNQRQALESQKQALEAGLEAKVKTVAKMLSMSLGGAVLTMARTMENYENVEESIGSARHDPDLIGVRVEDTDGLKLWSFGVDRNPKEKLELPGSSEQPPTISYEKNRLFVADKIWEIVEEDKASPAPGHKQANPIGVLKMVYSLDNYHQSVNSAEKAVSNIWRDGLLVALFIFILGSLIAAIVGNQMARSLGIMTSTFKRMSEGDLSMSLLKEDTKDEMGILANAFNVLLKQMRELTSKFNSLSHSMDSRTSEILTTARQQESGAAQQAATVSEVSATMEELAATAQQIANNAENVTTFAEEAATAVSEGRDSLSSLVQSMTGIESGNKMINDNIVQLNRLVQQIGGIIDLINDIADRSDLLALNAALEGTKAGQAGKGFLLVAAEMRRLAENVFSSTAEIKQLIAEVTEATNTAVMATESGMRTTKEGVERAQDAERAFGRIIDTIEETSKAAKQISLATQQQHTGTEQIVAAMGEVSDVAQKWVEGIRDTTRSVGELGTITANLKLLVDKYQTEVRRQHEAR